MLVSYAKWYSFTPPQRPNFPPPLTVCIGNAGADSGRQLEVSENGDKPIIHFHFIQVLGITPRDMGINLTKDLGMIDPAGTPRKNGDKPWSDLTSRENYWHARQEPGPPPTRG